MGVIETGVQGAWARELNYTQFTANVSVTATTEATANTVVTAGAVTFDGSTAALIHFFAPVARPDTTAAGRVIHIWLYQDGSSIGEIAAVQTTAAASMLVPVSCFRRLTPSSGSRTYSVRASVDVATGLVAGGAGGAGNDVPGFILITRA